MTEPAPTQDPTAPPTEPPLPTNEDVASLVPAVLAAYAAYRIFRGAHHVLPSGDWVKTATELGLKAIIGAQLLRLAYRALTHQRGAAGRPGDELLGHTAAAASAGVEAGIRTLAQGIVWTDQHADGDPTPKDIAQPGERGTLPTVSNPPDLMAEMVAHATVTVSQFQAARLAGWKTVTWRSMRDTHVRPTHQALDGQSVPLGTAFTTADGAKLRFPHDPRAPIAETANCRCVLWASRR